MHDPVYRKLLPSEKAKIREHFLRLDKEDRRLRFFGQVGDAFVESYCSKILVTDYAVLGCFIDGELRAIGELRNEAHLWNRTAEVAITVERAFQNLGIGTAILRQLIGLGQHDLGDCACAGGALACHHAPGGRNARLGGGAQVAGAQIAAERLEYRNLNQAVRT